ncbi:alpha/beta hydrolase [Alienimonas californiensis]|uniref:Acetylxylan esterase n=1 Tax=Alienimonas californiensis TaxID=2527989 RepID=A0A517P7L9_9PLAN|nr:alpha/beta hydrolase [Alienimonas californiensis]QDT15376.1 Acetylxylan esterase precursor [Alienimonas californiensis]
MLAALLPALLVPALAAPPVELDGPPVEGAVVLPLWAGAETADGSIPGGLADGADAPTLAIHVPKSPNGAAVIVCPGGGYHVLATAHEGRDVAKWLTDRGVTAAVLRYRVKKQVPGPLHPAPLLDVQRGIRLMRKHAKEYGVDPAKVGVLGFSAGGHLAASAATLHTDEARELNPLADADPLAASVSARPDFAVMIYPRITYIQPAGLREIPRLAGDGGTLFGAGATEEQLAGLSLQTQVTADTPPSFLVTTNGDEGVPAENSVLFWQACRAANVPAELHVFDRGGHGWGLGGPDSEARGNPGPDWTGAFETWLAGRGLIRAAE